MTYFNYVNEFEPHIKLNILADIIQIDSFNPNDTLSSFPILIDVDAHVLSIMRAYLANYFDWNILVSLKDTYFSLLYIDLFIYEVEQRVSYDKIPENRQMNYYQTMKQLEKISLRKVSPDTWPKLNNQYQKSITSLAFE